jgi:hypothetical protein
VAIPIPATPESTVLAISKRQSFVIEISLDLWIGRDRLNGQSEANAQRPGLVSLIRVRTPQNQNWFCNQAVC